MSVVVYAPQRSAESAVLLAALEAGVGAVRRVADPAAALAALGDGPRPVLLLDLRGEQGPAGAGLPAHCPGVPVAALLRPGGRAPPGCDAIFTRPWYLEDVVLWAARASAPTLADEVLADLAAGLSHEIGNPLTTILLQLELLRSDGSLGEDAAAALQLVEEAARRIQGTVRDVARAGERPPVQASACGLAPLLDDARQKLAARAPELAERIDLRCDHVELSADGGLLGTALADLWEVLLRAGSAGDRLTVSGGRRHDGPALVRHHTRAPRLPPDAAARLFTPLWARQALGLPLTLSLTSARNAFRRHRGDLRARAGPGELLTVEGVLPDESQRTLDFRA